MIPTLESCITTYKEAEDAVRNGATRLEVCAQIEVDGLTPDSALVRKILNHINVPVRVLIRPRAGNFIYDQHEKRSYIQEIQSYMDIPIDGIVIGALTDDLLPDMVLLKNIRTIVTQNICFHKAIDHCSDMLRATSLLVESGYVDGILSSGGQDTAQLGLNSLLQMKAICSTKVELIAAGKITKANRDSIHSVLNIRAYHGRKIC